LLLTSSDEDIIQEYEIDQKVVFHTPINPLQEDNDEEEEGHSSDMFDEVSISTNDKLNQEKKQKAFSDSQHILHPIQRESKLEIDLKHEVKSNIYHDHKMNGDDLKLKGLLFRLY